MRPLSIDGAFALEPTVHRDHRGSFHEWFRADVFAAATGEALPLSQANCSVSQRGTLRGVHYSDVPPGQAKYLTCVRGAVLDVLVDLRVDSPTYRRWEAVRLGEQRHTALYAGPGLGHAFLALTDDATMIYLCSSGYAPEHEHGIDPYDPDLGIAWPTDVPHVLSPKDAAAPSLAAAEAAAALPRLRPTA
ncbi:dTDP-4-dehydrorhamnose 3,5-epimerase family protein [Streptomyces sp. NPDC048392]|uniref:dTDP-4-dehydrorhamnose 3,5-epimerase family protein n=1 Tax=Streptomyces sp. NPDC048392 TaxID=3365543 RepID=UPI003719F052